MGKTWILKIPENGFDFRALKIYKLKLKPKDVPWTTAYDNIFVSTLYYKNWPSYGKMWPPYRPGDVIDDVISM